MQHGKIIKVSGPLVVAKGIENARLFDTVLVSDLELLGEIIEVTDDEAAIQVYEETSGIKLGEKVVSQYRPLSIELGPGILSSMLDGIGRDLQEFALQEGYYLTRGAKITTLSTTQSWYFHPIAKIGQHVVAGDYLGYVMENKFKHYIMVPEGITGTVNWIADGDYTITEKIATVLDDTEQEQPVTMRQYWPIRKQRPYKRKGLPEAPLVTGQRVIDTFFPVAKGGTACIPGPFGSGKTVVQHQLAKWSNSDVVVYIGCGERGNEMTDVLYEFPELIDPKTKEPLMNKTVLIANTSNMPVAAREASIYTGMSIAEYFRDMGYDVSLMADSTSRWAEALREMSGRLEEMPGDEGYPAYLASRLAQVYERAGIVYCQGSDTREGSVTMIGAVSPAGGDLSEPVTQATLRVAKVFWALDSSLAYSRHFPAINWLESYSLYQEKIDNYMRKHINRNFAKYRKRAMALLKEEQQLQEIVQLIGKDGLSDFEILKLEIARMLREDFLQQNAFVEEDTFTSHTKQLLMLSCIMEFFAEARDALMHDHVYIADILNAESIQRIAQMKFVDENELDTIRRIIADNKEELEQIAESLKEDQIIEGI
ncbi:V-type ATP synthase subunit A [Vagococcus acidifermentans]|uniref:V-type ATP synthase alpha chain n=1 Tax=Vagococcus acidifermentans TaxID=564710 RepID=A0A430B2G5_9ENTE|nr:V-type ATP synthase subunit A [Vagococcus acidifermentans]RSU14513.1 V-type ATP synthase subunit A [Vagococcus acidifermentans]